MGPEAALHPEIAAIVAASRTSALPDVRTVDIATRRRDYREMVSQLWPDADSLAEVSDGALELDGATLPSRLYVPRPGGLGGLIVFFHGGSFVVGDLDSHDGLCRRLSADTGLRLLSVDYRLAPEHPFPASIDDAIGALRLVKRERGRFGPPEAPLIVMGESAGATLAAVAASATRLETPQLAGQVLIYPTLGPELLTDSAHRFGSGYMLELEDLRFDYGQYLGEFADHTDARVSPLMSLDLSGSAPAIVVVAQCDPLRDEGLAYAGLLEHFGTDVEILEAEGMVHGFLRLGAMVPDALAIVDDLAMHLRRLLARDP
jgi:acetyl esterase